MTSLDTMVEELEHSVNEDTGKLVVRQLFDKVSREQLPLKTELTDDELKLITRMKLVGEIFDIDILKDVCDNFMKLRVSLNRKGRVELIDALKQITDNNTGFRGMSGIGSIGNKGLF